MCASIVWFSKALLPWYPVSSGSYTLSAPVHQISLSLREGYEGEIYPSLLGMTAPSLSFFAYSLAVGFCICPHLQKEEAILCSRMPGVILVRDS